MLVIAFGSRRSRSTTATRRRRTCLFLAGSCTTAFTASGLLPFFLVTECWKGIILRNHFWLVSGFMHSGLLLCFPLLHCTLLGVLWRWLLLVGSTIRLRRRWPLIWPISSSILLPWVISRIMLISSRFLALVTRPWLGRAISRIKASGLRWLTSIVLIWR